MSESGHPASRAFLLLARIQKDSAWIEYDLRWACGMLLRYGFRPRRNNSALVTAGSVITIVFSINGCSHSKKPVWGENQDWVVQKFGLRRPQRVDTIQAEFPFSIPHSRVKNTKGCSSRSANLVCKARENYHLNTQSNSFLVCFLFFFLEKSYKFYRMMAN